MRAHILISACLVASCLALKPRLSQNFLVQVDRDGSVGPTVSSEVDPQCCIYENPGYGGQSLCSNVSMSNIGGMGDKASSATTPYACTMELYSDGGYGGYRFNVNTNTKVNNLEDYEMIGTSFFKWWPTMWHDQTSSFKCSCTQCNWPCQDCVKGKPNECKDCPPGYVLNGTTCISNPVSGHACTLSGFVNPSDPAANRTTVQLTTRDDWTYLGNQMGGKLTNVSYPDACNGTLFSQRNNAGTNMTLVSGYNGLISSSLQAAGGVNSLKCTCLTCDAKCTDCKGVSSYCTKCIPSKFPTDGECWPDNGPEICFFDSDSELNWRECYTSLKTPVVTADFFDRAKFVRVPNTCVLRINQYWMYQGARIDVVGTVDTPHRGGKRLVMPTGKDGWSYRSLQVFCNGTAPPPDVPSTTPTPRLPPTKTESSFPTFEYLGCYKDNVDGQRDMDTQTFTRNMGAPKLPRELCAEFCYQAGNDFFALQNGDECHCGSPKWQSKQGKAADEKECDKTCDGARDVVCGGVDRNSVYKITNSANPTEVTKRLADSADQPADYEIESAPTDAGHLPPQDGKTGGMFAYLGCFDENAEGMPEFYSNALEQTGMTPSLCAKNCMETGLFALRENLCTCGSRDWTPIHDRAVEAYCASCQADNKFKCGSKRQNSIYKLFV